jgi:RNA polymerase sigma-70 factor (ECF subfamily)
VQSQLNECVARPVESAEYQREYRRQVFRWAAQKIRHEFQPATWDSFWLTCVGGVSIQEAATRLKLSVGSVYVARSRCVARLRAVVASLEDLSGEFLVEDPHALGDATMHSEGNSEGIDP